MFDLITADLAGQPLAIGHDADEDDYPGAALPRGIYVSAQERSAYQAAQERE